MKTENLQVLRQQLEVLDTATEQQVKGGYGRILGTRVPARDSRWDDIPFRLVRPRSSGIQKEATSPWTGLRKDSPLHP